MDKIITYTNEEIEKDKSFAKEILNKAFLQLKEMQINIDLPRHGHITLNPIDFEYNSTKEKYKINYKVQL